MVEIVKYVPTHYEVVASQVAPSAMAYLGLNGEAWKSLSYNLRCTSIEIIHGTILLIRTIVSPPTDNGPFSKMRYRDRKLQQIFEKTFSDSSIDLRCRATWYVVIVWLSIKQIICEYRPHTKQVIRAASGFGVNLSSKEVCGLETFVLLRLRWRTEVTLETYDAAIELLKTYNTSVEWRDSFCAVCKA